MTTTSGRLASHWIGAKIGWEDQGSIADALVSLPMEAFGTHGGCFGSSGGGKTTLIQQLAGQCIQLRHSFVILDMRGDLVAIMLKLLAGHVPAEDILLLDLREKERPTGFNPLAGSGEPYFKALGLTDLVEQVSSSWGVQVGETFQMVAMLLAESGGTLADFERVFFDEEFRLDALGQASDSVLSYWSRYGELPAERQASLASPVLNKISLLLGPPTLRRVVGHSAPPNLGEHLNRKGSVTLISLAVDELHGAARLMASLTLSSICREVFARVSIPEKDRNPVYLFVDEFEHFKSLDFPHIIAEGRRFGLRLIVSFQVLAQVDPTMRSLLLNNIGVKVIFRTGRDDGAVLSADLFGDRKAYDFSLLAPGQCVLSRRGSPAIEIEVNEPLVRSVGEGSPPARALRSAVLARNMSVADLDRRATSVRPRMAQVALVAEESHQPQPADISEERLPPSVARPTPKHRPKAPRATVLPASLEDWLCK